MKEYQGDVKWEFTCVLHHEMTHVIQWYGNSSPHSLPEGKAYYIKLKSNHFLSEDAKLGQGDKWDEGYDVTADS